MMMGLSQHDLSKAANVSIQQVQKYENGTNRISGGKLFRFSEYLGVPVNYFFEDESGDFLDSLAEDGAAYGSGDSDLTISEKEVITLVRAFGEVKDIKVRRKIIDLIKSMS
jgi:transcriptional regulator with XRE-family HTH domain